MGGTVVAVSAGPPSVVPCSPRWPPWGSAVVRVPWPDEGPFIDDVAGDEHRLARVLVAALEPFGRPDLVLCGDRSANRGTGALPAYVAHELGAAQALGLVSLAPAPADGFGPGRARALVAERRLDGGGRERLLVPPPAVCSVEAAGVRLRRAPLAALLDGGPGVGEVPPSRAAVGVGAGTGAPGEAEPVIGSPRPFRPRTRVVPAPTDDDPRLRILALTGALVAHDPPTLVGPVDAVGAADALVAFLARHGYLPDAPADNPAAGTAADPGVPA